MPNSNLSKFVRGQRIGKISALITAVLVVAPGFSTLAFPAQMSETSTICRKLKMMVSEQDIYFHMLERISATAGTERYPNLDFDGDGINDGVSQSCSSGYEGEGCRLEIKFSKGDSISIHAGYFFLARIATSVLLIEDADVSQNISGKRKKNIYLISTLGFRRICENYKIGGL